MVRSGRFEVQTQGGTQVLDITPQVAAVLGAAGVREGILVVFVVGSTAGITTTEAEPGLLTHDLKAFFERIAPQGEYYKHEATWNDDNGHAHVRASALGPSVALPVAGGRMTLGTWQQLVLIDFDTRGRKREVLVQIVGE